MLNICNSYFKKKNPYWKFKSNNLNLNYCFFDLVAAYLELLFLRTTFLSKTQDVSSSSSSEQSPVNLGIVGVPEASHCLWRL